MSYPSWVKRQNQKSVQAWIAKEDHTFLVRQLLPLHKTRKNGFPKSRLVSSLIYSLIIGLRRPDHPGIVAIWLRMCHAAVDDPEGHELIDRMLIQDDSAR